MSRNIDSVAEICVANQEDRETAFRIMKEVMSVEINESIWESITLSVSFQKPVVTVIKSNNYMLAALAYYPRLIKTGPNRFEHSVLFGQLCAPVIGKSLRKRGAAMELLVWTENNVRLSNIDIMMGLFSDELYKKYYRKYFGYSRLKMDVIEFNFFRTSELINCLSHKINNSDIIMRSSIIVKIVDGFKNMCMFKWDSNGMFLIQTDQNIKFDLCISGIVAPLFRFCTLRKSKKHLIKNVLLNKIKVKNTFLHPIKTFNLVINLYKISNVNYEKQ